MPSPPPPSQGVDFDAYIYTSTPYYTAAPTQLPPPTPAYSEQRIQSEVELSMSPPPLFIGSEGGFAEMEPDLDVLPITGHEVVDDSRLEVEEEMELDLPVLPIASQELIGNIRSGLVEEGTELDLPGLPRGEVVVKTERILMEIPDSEEESVTSSPVKRGSVNGDEELGIENMQEDFLIENRSLVAQENGGSEEQGGGDESEQMNDQDGNVVLLNGVDRDVQDGKLNDSIPQQNQECTAPEIIPLDSHPTDEYSSHVKDVTFVHPATIYEPRDMAVEEQIYPNMATAIEDQSGSFDKPHHFHAAIPYLEQEDRAELMSASALYKTPLDALDGLHTDKNGVENSTPSGHLESMGLDLGSASLEGDGLATSPINETVDMQAVQNTLSPFHVDEELRLKESEKEVSLSPYNCADDFGQPKTEQLYKEQEITNINQELTENTTENTSCTSTLDKEIAKLLTAETESTQPMECASVEDEVSLIPTAYFSQVKNTTTKDSVTFGEPEDVVMEDVPNQKTPTIADSPATQKSLSRATRRKSSGKSDATSDMTPKQSRRVSARGKSQLEPEVTKSQATIESSAMDLDNGVEVAEEKASSQALSDITPGMRSETKPVRNGSSTRKKSGRGLKAKEVSTPDQTIAIVQNCEEGSHERTIVPDPATEPQISSDLPKKAPATRRRSQRGTKGEDAIDTPALPEDHDVAIEKVTITTPAPELVTKVHTRKKSQRGTKAEEVVSIRADTPASLEENDEAIEKDPVMTPAPEPQVEVPTRKKSQRKSSSTSKKTSDTSTKRQHEDELEEHPENDIDTSTNSSSVPAITTSKSPEPQKPVVSQRPLLLSREGSQGKDILIAELKAIKIASIQARTASLEAEIAVKRAKAEEITKELTRPAAETVKRHIKLLHDYNDIRDVGQALVGMIADNRGVRIGELYDEFGVGLKD